MKIENKTCRDHHLIHDTPEGKHHEMLHNRIGDLEDLLERLRDRLQSNPNSIDLTNEFLASINELLRKI